MRQLFKFFHVPGPRDVSSPLDAQIEERARRATDQAIAYVAEQIDAVQQRVEEAVLVGLQERLEQSQSYLRANLERRIQLGTAQAMAFTSAKNDEVASTNEKLLNHIPALLNATGTVPALANLVQGLRKDIEAQRQKIDTLESSLNVSDLEEKYVSCASALATLQSLLAEQDQNRSSAQFSQQNDVKDLWKSMERLNSEVANMWKSAELATREIGKLWQRTEFVRAEILYEMKYGIPQPGPSERPSQETGSTAPRIINRALIDSPPAEGLRINLGCGHVSLPGYINVDFRALPDVDVVSDIDSLPFEDSSINEIYSAHVLEHLPQQRLKRLLPYWRSLLVPGGRFRAVVPDGEAMLAQHASGDYSFEDLREVLFGGQEYQGDFHFNLFTPGSLSTLLSENGYSNIIVVEKGRINGNCYEFEIVAARADDYSITSSAA